MVEGEGVEEAEPVPPWLPVGERVALGVKVGPTPTPPTPTPGEVVGAPVGAPEVGVAPPLAPPDPVGSTGAWV
jgi:hypothetical protein